MIIPEMCYKQIPLGDHLGHCIMQSGSKLVAILGDTAQSLHKQVIHKSLAQPFVQMH